MTTAKHILIAFILIPVSGFAGNVSMGSDEDCGYRVGQFDHLPAIQRGACERAHNAGHNTDELGCGKDQVMNVAHYMDRDNSMSDAEDTPAKSMMLLSSKAGKSQAVQVCPGVFLATAHGALNSPDNAARNGRPLGDPQNQRIKLYPYPVTSKMSLQAKDLTTEFISPRLRNPNNWSNPKTDYVFIKMNPQSAEQYASSKGFKFNSRNITTPINASPAELITASQKNHLDIHLYRGKTRFDTDENNTPDFNIDSVENSFGALQETYQKPQRVNTPCTVWTSPRDGHTSNNCPTETFVSGSPYVVELGNASFMTGMATLAVNQSIDKTSEQSAGSSMLNSSEFCADYQTACGQPCPSLQDALDNTPVETASIDI